MAQQLAGHGVFRDTNNQEWSIEVYRLGVKQYETAVISPDGTRYTPEDDVLGDFSLIDAEGKRHTADLPMDMADLQLAVEKVEDAAWLEYNNVEAQAVAEKGAQSWKDKVQQEKAAQMTGQSRG